MGGRWTESADTAVRLASALDWEHGGRRLVDLAERLGRTESAVRHCDVGMKKDSKGRTESAVRQRASRLRALQLDEDVDAVDGPSVMR